MSIRLRLTLWYIVLLTSTLILLGVILYGIVRYSFYNEVERTLYARAQFVEDSVHFVLDTPDYTLEQHLLNVEESEPSDSTSPAAWVAPFDIHRDVYIELRYFDGIVARTSSNLNDQELPLSADALARIHNGEPSLVDTHFAGEPVKLLSQPVIYEEKVWGMVQVAHSLVDVEEELQRLLFFTMTGIGLALIGALVIGAWLAERALTPVDAVTQAALRISRAEDLSRRLPPSSSMDEIGRLVAAFNEMLGHLDDVFSDQQRFVADVSHELRTPLTALQGNIELLKLDLNRDPERCSESLRIIESEVARLSRLVSDLLLLARADGGEKLVRQPVELDTLLLDVFRQGHILLRASKQPIRLRLGHEDQATILGDPDRLKQLFFNLVDNAIKYTQEGEVILSLWKDQEAREVRVSVQDTGIGIAAEAQPFLFRRFYRTDKARSRQLGGTGLGLAIVQWILRAHDATIEVESKEGEGSTFTVTFPLPSAEALMNSQKIETSRRTTSSYPLRAKNGSHAQPLDFVRLPRANNEGGSPASRKDAP